MRFFHETSKGTHVLTFKTVINKVMKFRQTCVQQKQHQNVTKRTCDAFQNSHLMSNN